MVLNCLARRNLNSNLVSKLRDPFEIKELQYGAPCYTPKVLIKEQEQIHQKYNIRFASFANNIIKHILVMKNERISLGHRQSRFSFHTKCTLADPSLLLMSRQPFINECPHLFLETALSYRPCSPM